MGYRHFPLQALPSLKLKVPTLGMTYTRLDEPQPRRRFGCLQIGLLLGFLISLVIGMAALLGLYTLDRSAPAAPQPEAANALQPSRIPPQLALLQLADTDADALGRQAVNARERALGYAIFAYDDTLGGARRATELLRLGQYFLNADETAQAVASFRTARTLATFAADIGPLERGQLLTRSAVGLLEAGAVREAVESAQQVQHAAVQMPDLLPAQRVQILRGVEPILRAQGTPAEAQQIREILRNPNLVRGRVMISPVWPTLQEALPLDEALQTAIITRQAAAQRLIDRLVATGGADFEAERSALREALLAEDTLRAQRYAGVNTPVLTLRQQHFLIQEQRSWLILKLRIALGGFGVDLVPDWAGQPDAIRLSLNQVTSNLLPVVEAQIAALSDSVERALLRVETLHWFAYQSEMGFYPNAPLGELATRLESAQAELEQLSRPLALPIFYNTGSTPPGFRIAQRY